MITAKIVDVRNKDVYIPVVVFFIENLYGPEQFILRRANRNAILQNMSQWPIRVYNLITNEFIFDQAVYQYLSNNWTNIESGNIIDLGE